MSREKEGGSEDNNATFHGYGWLESGMNQNCIDETVSEQGDRALML